MKDNEKEINIGVLAFQGDLEENIEATKQAMRVNNTLGTVARVRYAEEIDKIDGLIIPGGESTVIGTLASLHAKTREVLRQRIMNGMPVLGTCAGLILLSKRAYDRNLGETKQQLFGILDIVTERNAFGRQKESFEADVKVSMKGSNPFQFKGVFIRAPVISDVGENVEIISSLNDKIVGVKQDNIIGVAFHPELSSDYRVHSELIQMVKSRII
jgi:pyridoxal 5'-phosphate synthase pdxT subunit